MLSLLLKSGEYLTIGEDIAVQIFEESGCAFRVSVKAPREIPIVRGELLERTGTRPNGLYRRKPKSPSEQKRNAKQMEKLAARQEYYAEKQRQEAAENAAAVSSLLSLTNRMEALAAAGDQAGMLQRLDALRQGIGRFGGAPEGAKGQEKDA